jgi:pimeloyl-ACP methyl ester carboxylesterase
MTLARGLRALVVSLAAVAAVWAVEAWRRGQPVAMAAGLLLVLGVHAGCLAIEVAIAWFVNRGDTAPRATLAEAVRAWAGEWLAALRVFGWWQPFRHQAFPDHLPARPGGRRGLLLVHGYVCNRGIWRPWLERLVRDGTPFVALSMEPVFGSIDAYAERIEEGVRRLEAATGRAPVIVAHSMGGLAARRWAAEHAGAARVRRFVTLGTPHAGTWIARWGFTANAREMRRESRWLATLGNRERGGFGGFTCFHSHADNIVFPASTATLPGADNRHLRAVAHVAMVLHPEPWAEVQRWLAAPDEVLPAPAPAPAADQAAAAS